MFYAQFVLSKKGPLAKIWLAAHWEKKLTKAQVYETDVEKAVTQILEPKVKMALRTTGHLLLGIVRIYSRKAKYLLADCNEAFLKIKMAFRPGQVDLPDDAREANYNTITLPEVFHDFDSALPDFNEIEFQQQLSLNQSRLDDITLKEDLPKASDAYENEFGLGVGLDDFGDAAFGDEDMEPERDAISFANPNEPYSAHSTRLGANSVRDEGMGDLMDPIPDDFEAGMDVDEDFMGDIFNDETLKAMEKEAEAVVPHVNHDDSFQLESLDTTVVQGLEKHRVKRKRKLIVDENKNISGEDMKAQMSASNDTIGALDLAPPTKKLMHCKKVSLPEKLFNTPSSEYLQSKHLEVMLVEHFIPHAREDDASERAAMLEELELARQAEIDEEEDRQLLHTIQEENVEERDELAEENVPSVSPINDMDDIRSPDPAHALDSPPMHDKSRDKKDSAKKERKERSKNNESKFDDTVEDGEDQDEKRWTKRTHQVLQAINTKLKTHEHVNFTDLCRGATRKSAAQKFYTLLALKKMRAIEIGQDAPYGEISLTQGPQFKACLA